MSVVASEHAGSAESLFRRGLPVEIAGPGTYVEVVEVPVSGGPSRHVGRRLTDAWGRVPPGQTVRRPAYRTIPGDLDAGTGYSGTNGAPPGPQLAEAPPAATPTVVDHRHVRHTCPDKKTWKADGSTSVVSRAAMNPGFLKADDTIRFDGWLDKKLIDLLVDDTEYRKQLARESVTKRWPSTGDRIRIALVDLTGDKICRPGYAGWGSTRRMSGASTAKIAMLYAAHQLVFDLNQLAKSRRSRSKADLFAEARSAWSALTCKPDLGWLVSVDESTDPVRVAKSGRLDTHLTEMVDASYSGISTSRASELILRLGFEYIGSLMWQSGLRHPSRGGLWIGNTFMAGPTKAKPDPACHAGTKPIRWAKNPFGGGIVLTALSLATFFTLLAQRRLITAANSADMERVLSSGCRWFSVPGVTVRASKCGLTSTLRHEAALLEKSGSRRYVLVCLSQQATWSEATRDRLLADLDRLIKENNP